LKPALAASRLLVPLSALKVFQYRTANTF